MNTQTGKPCDAPRFVSTITDDRGLSTVEYVVLLVLVVAACVGLWVNFGQSLRDKLTLANGTFQQVTIQAGNGQVGGPTGNTAPTNAPVANSPAALVPAPMAETKTKEDR